MLIAFGELIFWIIYMKQGLRYSNSSTCCTRVHFFMSFRFRYKTTIIGYNYICLVVTQEIWWIVRESILYSLIAMFSGLQLAYFFIFLKIINRHLRKQYRSRDKHSLGLKNNLNIKDNHNSIIILSVYLKLVLSAYFSSLFIPKTYLNNE